MTGQWEEHWDAAEQRNYYYNPETEETTWDKPDELDVSEPPTKRTKVEASPPEAPSGWEAHLDESSGNYYFYNKVSGVTTWEMPQTIEEPPVEVSAAAEEAAPAPTIEASGDDDAETGADLEPEVPEDTPEPPQVPEGWEAHWDAEAKTFYYHNQSTNETTWDKPTSEQPDGSEAEAEMEEPPEEVIEPEPEPVAEHEINDELRQLQTQFEKQPLTGVQGGSMLREELSQRSPMEVITAIQRASVLKVTAAHPAVELLSFLGARRSEVYMQLHSSMLSHMIEAVQKKPVAELGVLLAASFQYITVEGLRQIPLAILSKMPKIPAEFIHHLSLPAIYPLLPHSVKRQVWHVLPENFVSELAPIVAQCIDKLKLSGCCDLWRVAHHSEWNCGGQMELITQMVADSALLYQWTIQHLCDKFIEHKIPQYCLLRVLIVGAIQKSGNPTALATDPSRRVALAAYHVLDTPNGRISSDQLTDLVEGWQALVLSAKSSKDFPSAPAGDILNDTMVLAAPPLVTALLLALFHAMHRVIMNEADPKSDVSIKSIVGLIECSSTTMARLAKAPTGNNGSGMRGSSTRRRQPALSGKPSRPLLNVVCSMTGRLVDDEISKLQGVDSMQFELPAEALSPLKMIPAGRLVLAHYMLRLITEATDAAAVTTVASFVMGMLRLPDSDSEDDGDHDVVVNADAEIGVLLHSIGKVLVESVEASHSCLHGKHAVVRNVVVEELLLPLAPDHIEAHFAAIHLLSCVPVVNAMGDARFGEALQTLVPMGCRTSTEQQRLQKAYELLAEKHHDRLQGNPVLQHMVDQMNDELAQGRKDEE